MAGVRRETPSMRGGQRKISGEGPCKYSWKAGLDKSKDRTGNLAFSINSSAFIQNNFERCVAAPTRSNIESKGINKSNQSLSFSSGKER